MPERDAAKSVLSVLQEIQERAGYVSRQAVAEVAAHLNLSRAEVDGVVSFYTDLRTSPPPEHVVKVCRAEACQASGARAVWDAAEAAAARSDGTVGIEAVYCLGNCACGPSAMSEDRVLGRMSPERIEAVLDALGQERRA
ncbi:MAG: NAD(P)H-dependent oxidoreductase subunit E [Acidihalobacter sp.]|jgi:formate dehydrogenase subunit gamma|uniref:NADH-quinone oxidoreductase subunit NuoE family protein n=1 Tax=Acidihalobacter sp. TaxID=1872108 RepID=UPI00307F3212